MARRSGRYTGSIDSKPLTIKNAPRDEFRMQLEALPFLAYEVEHLADGRTVCITKPGGKNPYGRMKVHDFMVWVYNATTGERWRMSHQEILDDVQAKLDADRPKGEQVVRALMAVYNGQEPDDVLAVMPSAGIGLPGEAVELLIKVYKWIWGQEDCNYPTGEGRYMSMKVIEAISGIKSDAPEP